jgi:protein-S-isoprenylcysteine O-methyltransferase Ste14
VSANAAIQNLTVTATPAAVPKKKSPIKTIAVAVGCAAIVITIVGLYVAWRCHRQVLSMTVKKEPEPAYFQMNDR